MNKTLRYLIVGYLQASIVAIKEENNVPMLTDAFFVVSFRSKTMGMQI